MTVDVEKVIECFEKRKIEYFNDLKSLVKIPSVSFDGFDPAHVRKSAEVTAELMKKHGLENVQILDQQGSHPYAYGEWLKNPGAPTLLLYAHHDVQPPGRENIWNSPPFEPTQKDGRLYGRGAADDKAGIMVHLAAISSYLGTFRQLPVNVRLIVEGEEEIGSTHLEDFLKSHKELLQADVMVLTDTTNFDVGFPALTVALRGLVAVTVEMRSLKGSIHSGMWGGPVPDPVVALSKVISKLTDDNGDLAIPELLKKVKPLSKDHQSMLAHLPYNEASFKHQSGMLDSVKISGAPGQNVYAKMWHLPSVSVNAVEASSRKMAGNIINDVVWAKIGLRIVPDMDPNESLEILSNFIRKNTPWGIDVKITPESTGPAWSTKTDSPVFERAMIALEKGYKKQPVMMGCGGSIPFVGPFSEALGGAPALLIGVEDPMSNAHGENESLHIEDWEKCCKSSIYLFDEIAKLSQSSKKLQ